MKGVILAGGLGTRLSPLTRVTNKHLLPVYDKPMIYYPLQALLNAGIEEILLVTGGNHAGEFLRLLGDGRELGIKRLHYTYQQGEGGIAAALSLAEHFADGERICVILGDNIIERNIQRAADRFRNQVSGAKLLLKRVPDPERFGVPKLRGDKVVRIIEKPKNPPSRFAVTGIYFYDGSVFDRIRRVKPSKRNELEITDVNNLFIESDEMTYEILRGWWTDAGTFESLHRASQLVAKGGANKV